MFSSQHLVPKLPIPLLHSTFKRYADYIKPLVPSNEYTEELRIMERFAATDAPVLQKMLQSFDATIPNSSYIADIWEDAAYLKPRCSVMINVNPSLLLPDEETTQVAPALPHPHDSRSRALLD